MVTLQATINPALLSKANRLFTGTLSGRIIEILQNARRAGAHHVQITNDHGWVTVQDDGPGIGNFNKLLDLGGSGWEDDLEASEDPAGVGLFSLAPRELTIRSNGKVVTIAADGWTGRPIPIQDDPEPVQGTHLRFQDEAWTLEEVKLHAVFSGLHVTVDGESIEPAPFVSDAAVHYSDMGVRIEVLSETELSDIHRMCYHRIGWRTNALVNFHGQLVAFAFNPVGESHLHYLIEMTGDPTDIRLMLPARTCLVENDALDKLQRVMEMEGYWFIAARGDHHLAFEDYQRAHELGIDLPEATPTYQTGLLDCNLGPEPVEVILPEDFPLKSCYRLGAGDESGGISDEINVHLLAALGEFDRPFIPVDINPRYEGYSWAKLPTIDIVEHHKGDNHYEEWIWGSKLICVDRLSITARTSDGQVFSSDVCMAVDPKDDMIVYVTPEAQDRLLASQIWFHLGGFSDEGDTYETQLCHVEELLDEFWLSLIDSQERLRLTILETLRCIPTPWQSVNVTSDGIVAITETDGKVQTLQPGQ